MINDSRKLVGACGRSSDNPKLGKTYNGSTEVSEISDEESLESSDSLK